MDHTKKHLLESEPRITIFTIPRAFTGEHKIGQENTLGSWIHLVPRPEILLFCDDPGVAEAAEQFDCVHVPDIRCSESGIPYVGHAFYLASQLATNDILCYANADIIFIQDCITAIDVVARSFDQPFLIIGQRWDVSMPEPLKFTGNWQQCLRARARQRGNLHPPSAMDYFIYSRGAIVDMPDFLVGSPRWDNWVVKDAERRGIQIISATKAITCIHQHHRHMWPAEGVKYNRRLWRKSGGGVGYAYSGSWILGTGAKLRSKPKAKVVPSRVAARPKPKSRFRSKPQPRPWSKPQAQAQAQPQRTRPPRPPRVAPKDELGLPINLNIPAQELVAPAKRLRRQARVRTPSRKKHSHSGPPEREILLAKRARLQQVRDTIRAARIAARDARQRKREKRP